MGRRQKSEEAPARGVSIRKTPAGNEVLQIGYTFKRKRYRHSLNFPPTPANIRAANQKISQIRLEIKMNVYDPERHFDMDTPQARAKERTIAELVKDRMDRKLRITGAQGWEESTYGERLKMFNKHIEPNFGHLTLPELTGHHIKIWLKKCDFGLSYGQLIMSLLNPIVKDALAEGIIEKHPYQHIRLTEYLGQATTQQRKERIDPLDEGEIHLLLQAFTDPQARNYHQFMLFSGLRMQEGPVVEWGDIDWNNRTITVSRAVGFANNEEYLKTTKTGEERIVELIPPAWDALMNQRQHTQLNGGLIFRPANKTRSNRYDWMARTHLRSTWTSALKKAGIRHKNRSPKQTRHTFCSLMIAAGKPLTWVAQQVGHSSLAMLEKHYAKAVRLAAGRHQDYDFGQALEDARKRQSAAE